VPTRIGVRHPKLSQVIQMMESQYRGADQPRDPGARCGHVGGCRAAPPRAVPSARQVARAFQPEVIEEPSVTTKVTGRPGVILRRPKRIHSSSRSWSMVPRLTATPRISSISARVTGW
jgi:hypothetical protein